LEDRKRIEAAIAKRVPPLKPEAQAAWERQREEMAPMLGM
jgi:hypothetical protein